MAEAVRALEGGNEAAVSALKRAVEDYVAFQFRHIQLEEEQVLPKAEAVLTAMDWERIDNAFARNSDPMFGENLSTGFQVSRDGDLTGRSACFHYTKMTRALAGRKDCSADATEPYIRKRPRALHA